MTVTFRVIGYSTSGNHAEVENFEVPQGATNEKIKQLARDAIGGRFAVPSSYLTLVVDRANGYVHIRDIITASFAGF